MIKYSKLFNLKNKRIFKIEKFRKLKKKLQFEELWNISGVRIISLIAGEFLYKFQNYAYWNNETWVIPFFYLRIYTFIL